MIQDYMDQNLRNSNVNDIYDNSSVIINNNEIQNNRETTITENQNTESLLNTSTILADSVNKRKNFIKKPNSEENAMIFENEFISKKKAAAELSKSLDNYFLPNLIEQVYNQENKSFIIDNWRNYKQKGQIWDFGNKYPELYYKIKINDLIFCAYKDEDYNLYKRFFIDSNQNNNIMLNPN